MEVEVRCAADRVTVPAGNVARGTLQAGGR